MPQKLAPALLSWASEVDENTTEQAARTSRLPFIQGHVALMPDAHWGIGSTVGSVIPTKGAIVPAAVGVDIGCVDADSEYLSPSGWRKISEYAGGPVMQYDPFTEKGAFVQPAAYIVKECSGFYRLKTKYGIDQMLSPDHRVLCWKITGRSRRRSMLVLSAEHFADEHERLKQGFKAEFRTTFTPDLNTKIDLSDAAIRVQVMVNADSTLNHGAAVLHLRKERKIKRARDLLNAAGLDWTESVVSDGSTSIRFEPPLMEKSYEPFWQSSADQLAVIADECLRWDGNLEQRCFYTRVRAEADFIQYVFTACGYRAVLRSDDHYRDGEADYRVFASTNRMVSMAGAPKTDITTEPSPDGFAYCFTTPSGYWVMRRGGNVAMTGNCGMVGSETTLTAADLPDDLGALMPLVEQRIPAGVGKGHSDPSADAALGELGDPHSSLTGKQVTTVARQFGTLGSGNHFVEVCLDERDRVWTVLHSGSRGIGNQLAKTHIDKARKLMRQWFIELEDPDLAYLAQGTPEFTAYIEDMLWCQRYAMASRAKMNEAIVRSLFQVAGGGGLVRTMNCHHNFTAFEHHHGRDMWITRKGAIKAASGDEGIIPGSMGTSTFIVKGLGSAASYDSCSHGAGRRMSRGDARRKLSPESLAAAMGSRTWNADRAADLVDEHPDAYKDVEAVMRDQADLCAIQHTLHQVFNYKG